MTDSPGQRCVETCTHTGPTYDEEGHRLGAPSACVACIDAAIDARTELMEAEARHAALVIVRRERADALVNVEALCVDYRWRNRKEHGYVDAEPCGYCGACRAALILRGRYAEERVNAIAARAAQEEKDDE